MDHLNQKQKIIFEEKTSWKGKEYHCQYIDEQDFSKVASITQVQALCFLSTGEFVIYQDKDGKYGLPGGTVEKNESSEHALFRELKEEAAIKPIKYGHLLYLRVINLSGQSEIVYQARYWALVDLLKGVNIEDPDGKAVRRLLVNKEELLKCVNWGRKLEVYLNQLEKIRKNNTNLTI